MKEITLDFFENFVKPGVYQSFVSIFVLQEINQTTNQTKRDRLIKAIGDYFIENLEIKDISEVRELANLYMDKAVIPAKKVFDALYIAAAVTH